MTNREDEILANIGQPITTTTPTTNSPLTTGNNTINDVDDPANDGNATADFVNNKSLNQNNDLSENLAQDTTTANGQQLSDLWTENPPSSASSGFSDDDSLIGAEGDPKTIEQIVDMVKERGRQGLFKEYAEIRSRAPDGTFICCKLKNNLSKNRYTDVLCYDHSRVVLSTENDDPTSDYINANFVDGYKQKNAYISTQGERKS
jgi:tyrosine-protein phosphatase non-receptor type 9